MDSHQPENPFRDELPDKYHRPADSSSGSADEPDLSLNKIVNIPGDDNRVLIECPGASLYKPGTDEVARGVSFRDADDPSRGYDIIGSPVYGPRHVRYRWVKKEDLHLIRRCQSCQDYTVRMRRKEGPDLYIPGRSGRTRPTKTNRTEKPPKNSRSTPPL